MVPGVFVGVVPQREVVGGFVEGVSHLGAAHRLAEVVARVDGHLCGIALHQAALGGEHAHFVLGLLVLLHFELGVGNVAVAALDVDRIRSQAGRGPQRHFVVDRPGGAHRERLLIHRLLLGIVHPHRQGLAGRDGVSGRPARPHHGPEVNRVAGAVDRPVGVGVARVLFAVGGGRSADHVHGVILAVPRHHAQAAQILPLVRQLGDAVGVGLGLAKLRIARQH